MSRKWTDQQKLLHDTKQLGGAKLVGKVLEPIGCWGTDSVIKLFDNVSKIGGIDEVLQLLGMIIDLRPENAKMILADAIAKQHKNVTVLRKRA